MGTLWQREFNLKYWSNNNDNNQLCKKKFDYPS